MKVGIITFQRAHNFGAVLQAFALKKALEDMGHVVALIDYWPEYRKGMYQSFDFSFIRAHPMSLKERVKRFLMQPRRLLRYFRFEKFITTYLGLSGSKIYARGEDIPDSFDVYIYGSDQIWRYITTSRIKKGFDDVYWGAYPITNSRKITYAASMGVLYTEQKQMNYIRQHLKNFDAVSVRESELFSIIKKISKVPIYQVLDPVFLPSEAEWRSIMSTTRKPKKKYLVLYNLKMSKDASNVAAMIAHRSDLAVVEISDGRLPLEFNQGGDIADGPLEYISLIAGAEFVVSTSFHGVAFSILFQKQFYALGMGQNSGRVRSILENLEISDRLINSLELVDFENLKNINYSLVIPKLELARSESLQFLKNNLF